MIIVTKTSGVCVCVFIKLHITTQSGSVILAILCYSHLLPPNRGIGEGIEDLINDGIWVGGYLFQHIGLSAHRGKLFFPVPDRVCELGLPRQVRLFRLASARPFSTPKLNLVISYSRAHLVPLVLCHGTAYRHHRVSPDFMPWYHSRVPVAFTAESPPAEGE